MTGPQARRHYSRAPIAEALIDIQTGAELGSLKNVEALAIGLQAEFPTRLPIRHVQMGFQVEPGGDPEFTKDQQTLGYRLDRPGRVLQFRTNGFTYSHLPPYSNWPTFSAEAEKYWMLYAEAIKPILVSRIAVRVINRLLVPPGDTRLDSWLNFYPMSPVSLPADILSVIMQLQLPMKHVDPDAVAIVGLYNAPPAPGPSAIMLDIDFFVQRSMPIGEAFKTLCVLGDAKDEIFEACITDQVREMIS
jgi:uncharacterized protein (TIGR04255 family)